MVQNCKRGSRARKRREEALVSRSVVSDTITYSPGGSGYAVFRGESFNSSAHVYLGSAIFSCLERLSYSRTIMTTDLTTHMYTQYLHICIYIYM